MTQNYYDGIAPGYNQLYGDEQAIKLEKIAELIDKHNIKINSKTKLLDVGCGTGLSSDFFAQKYGASVDGIDPSLKLIEQNLQSNSKLLVGEAENLPYLDNTYDVIVSVSAIQNFTNIQTAFDEMRRVAKPNTTFILTFMSKENAHAPKIDRLITQNFEIVERAIAKNDTVYLSTSK